MRHSVRVLLVEALKPVSWSSSDRNRATVRGARAGVNTGLPTADYAGRPGRRRAGRLLGEAVFPVERYHDVICRLLTLIRRTSTKTSAFSDAATICGNRRCHTSTPRPLSSALARRSAAEAGVLQTSTLERDFGTWRCGKLKEQFRVRSCTGMAWASSQQAPTSPKTSRGWSR